MGTHHQEFADHNEMRALRSASIAAEPLTTRVLLAPWGNVASTNGDFLVDEESAGLAVRAFEQHGTELPIDYEHQTLGGAYSSPNGQAPAAGWIKQISFKPGVGIFADIEWTQQARGMLHSKEYRYLSPVAIIRKSDRKLIAIHSAALTNKPAIVGMTPIVNKATQRRSDGATKGVRTRRVSERPITSNQGPAEVSGSPCLRSAVAGHASRDQEDEAQALVALRQELSLSEELGVEEVFFAASRRIAELNEAAKLRHVESRIREAMRQGKLVEAQRAWAEALVAREEGLFDEWLRSAPVIVQPGSTISSARSLLDTRAESIAARARGEYRANAFLKFLTTEDAYVADSLREAA